MKKNLIYAITAITLLFTLSAAQAGWNPDETNQRKQKANDTTLAFKQLDPGLQRFFDRAYGMAVFPTVGKGGLILGGAYGQGLVYRQGTLIGSATLTQLSIGFQIGGQGYSEIIFFEDKAALDRFTRGRFEFSAQVSAIAVKQGASKDVAYNSGVAVFTLPKGGLMAEAAVGGQKFNYQSKR